MSKLTENAIKQSCLKLLKSKPLKEITVNAITNDCGVSRNTFYYHFNDIPELIETIIKDMVDTSLSGTVSFESLEESFTKAYEILLENKYAFYNLFNSANRDILEKELIKISDYIVRTYVNTIIDTDKVDKKELEMIITFYKCEILGQIIAWFHDGMRTDLLKFFKEFYEVRKDLIEEFAIKHNIVI